MKAKWDSFVEMMTDGEYSKRECVLAVLVLFLLGVLLGIFLSPKKWSMIGSNNGNNNTGSLQTTDEDEN